MSYDISLVHPVTRDVLHAERAHHMQGGTYQMGGTTELWLNVTYNYSAHLGRVLPGGLPGLYGKTGAESQPLLKAAIAQLGDDVDADYWKATEGNVKAALCQLLALAEMRPDGVWAGD